MGKEAEVELSNAEQGMPPAIVAEAAPVEETKQAACCPAATPFTDDNTLLALRLVGGVTIFLAIFEFGLGGALFNFFTNVKLGAWWVGILSFFAGLCAVISLNKTWAMCTFVIAFAAMATSIVGAALDGVSSHAFRAITACASITDATSPYKNYGLSRDYAIAQQCAQSFSTVVSDGCYCVSRNLRTCNEYTLSDYAKFYNQDCGNIITTYSQTMATSTAFCVFNFIVLFTLVALTGYVLFAPAKEAADPSAAPATVAAVPTPAAKVEDKDHIPEESAMDPAQPEVPPADVVREVGSAIIA